ncbi:MAG: hypothetical protein WBQ10_02685 [Terriglobales bacterium]
MTSRHRALPTLFIVAPSRFRLAGRVVLTVALMITCGASSSLGQEQRAVVPTLVNFSGTLTDATGKPVTGTVGVTFYLYEEQQGGSPLWMETQNVQPDKNGHYTVALGAGKSEGLPLNLFASGEARWLGVQAQGQAEQPRVLLLSVPYALKAGDAQTVGGLSASAFVLAAPPNAGSSTTSSNSNASPNAPPLSGTGTTDYLPIWTNSTTLGSSVLFQSGTGAKAKVGIGTTKPASALDVKGGGTIRGLFSLPAIGAATATAGFNSQPIDLAASAFNSGTSTAVTQTFQWQSEPVGNNTSNATGSLNLLFGQGTGKPSETGLNIASNGQINFAKGQKFPGTGNGTITGVAAGTDLTGGGNSGNVTVNLDTTKVPQLSGNNSFTGNQSVNGSVTATSFSGNGASVTNVNASQLGSLGAGSFAQLASANTFTNNNAVSVNSSNTALQVSNAGNGDALDVLAKGGAIGMVVTGGYLGVEAYGSTLPLWGTGGPIEGVEGDSNTDAYLSPGIFGMEYGTTQPTVGVFGETASASGAGVYGQNQSTQSTTGAGGFTFGTGVWGDGGAAEVGLMGTTDNRAAGFFANNTDTYYTVEINNESTYGSPFYAGNALGNYCYIDYIGNLNCSGAKNAVVPIDGGQRKVALSAIESPRNWFEDAGSTSLANGAAVVAIDPEFIQTVNTELEYQVFLTPYGDCKGLYVANRTANSFEVRELGGGTANVSFGYRIMALRKNYENVRFADHTHDPVPMKRVKRETPNHFDINKLLPPKRDARLAAPVVKPANK